MARRWTTRCCCLCLAIVAGANVLGAQSATPTLPPFGLFPLRLEWELALGNLLTAPPALVGTQGYFPIEGGRIVAYDLHDGSQRWIAQADPRLAPSVGDGLLFLVEAETITALDEESGNVAWRLPFAEALAAPLVWDNGWLIAATKSGTILAFRAKDGHLIWRRELGVELKAAPVPAADRVYVPSAGRVIALRIEGGEPMWDRRIGGEPTAMLAVDDRVYVGSTDNYLYCLLAKDGVINWRFQTGGDIIGLPVLDERRVYFASKDNLLRGLDRRSGVQHWKRVVPLRPTRGPIRAGDALIVSGVSLASPAYAMKDGTPIGEVVSQALLYASPHVIPAELLPKLLIVMRDVAHGTVVQGLTRSIEPVEVAIAPLPNAIDAPVAPPDAAESEVSDDSPQEPGKVTAPTPADPPKR